MFNLFKKKSKMVYRIICGECKYVRITNRPPNGNFAMGFNLLGEPADYCPECNHCGGAVERLK